MKRGFASALLLAASACAARPSEPGPALHAAIVRYYESLSARDWEALRASFWRDATLTTVWQPAGEPVARVVTTSIDDFIAQAPAGPGSRAVFEERPVSVELRAGTDIATAWVRYAARFGDPGAVSCWTGTDAITLLHHDDEWRIVSIVYESDGDAGPGRSAGCG